VTDASFGESLEEASRLIQEVAMNPGTSERRSSLAGIHALELASAESLSAHTVAGLTNALTGSSPHQNGSGYDGNAIKIPVQTTPTSPSMPPAPPTSTSTAPTRRLSLAEKVKAIKANAGVGAGGDSSSFSLSDTDSSEDQPTKVELLSPEFFKSSSGGDVGTSHSWVSFASPLNQQQQPLQQYPDKMDKNVIRKPDAPDGSRGFGERRRSSVMTAQ